MPSRPDPVQNNFDVVIVGAGVVGAAIARALSFFDVSVALVDAASDVGAGTSKANSAILHTGFDSTAGSLEAKLVRQGHALLSEYATSVGIALEQTGALVVAWTPSDQAALSNVLATAHANAYSEASMISKEELYKLEPHLGPGALGAVLVPGESIICPFSTPLAFATEAVLNGVTLLLNSPLTKAQQVEGGPWELVCGEHTLGTTWVVNAAGLHSDTVAEILGQGAFSVLPRKGQFIVFDKHARSLVSRIILNVPSESGKGVLVAPTVFGNVLLGPTSEDMEDKTATFTTAQGMDFLLERAATILPALSEVEVTSTYAGLRAVSDAGNYDIGANGDTGYAKAIGIRSTGLTASMAIAHHLLDEFRIAGLELTRSPTHDVPQMPPLGEQQLRPYENAAALAGNSQAGHMACFCELVSAAELEATLSSPIPPNSMDGLRRRTRATAGRCQGFYCGAQVSCWFEQAKSNDVPLDLAQS